MGEADLPQNKAPTGSTTMLSVGVIVEIGFAQPYDQKYREAF